MYKYNFFNFLHSWIMYLLILIDATMLAVELAASMDWLWLNFITYTPSRACWLAPKWNG